MNLLPFAAALLLTLAVEGAAALLLGVRDKLDFLLIAAGNLLTNPAVNLLMAAVRVYAPGAALPVLAALEAGAVLGEWALYRSLLAYRKLHPLLLSVILNAASFAAGLLWRVLRGA